MHLGTVRELRQASASEDRYAEAGVDIAAGNALVDRIKPLAAATRRAGSAAGLGGFGGLFDLAACGYRDPLLVATTDGVGTKILLAQEAGRLDGIGQDLVAMCVNDLVVQGAEPLFFLDYYASGRLDVDEAALVVGGIAAACRACGCALIGGETAEMPGLYRPGEFDLAGFAVGAVERDAVLPRPGILPGDAVLGLASSGPHSNGFSLIRAILKEQGLGPDDPAPFPSNRTLGEALLAPTRLYVAPLLETLRQAPGAIKGLAHITGGGLLENLPRVLPEGARARLDASTWPLPSALRWLKEAGGLSDHEMGRTLNAGIGMAVVVESARAGEIMALLQAEGETVFSIGHIEQAVGAASVEIDGTEQAWAAEPRS
jgi:phosphoribosylformylglycinamidine cyclo-ligase